MLKPAARDDIACCCQSIDNCLVCVTFVALIGQYTFANEARGLRSERAVLVDRIRDGRVDTPLMKLSREGRPDIEVLASMTWRGMHEACTGVVSDMVSNQKRHVELVSGQRRLEWVSASQHQARRAIVKNHVV